MQVQQLNRSLNKSSASYFPTMSNLLSASYVYLWDSRMLAWLFAGVWQKIPSYPWPVEGNKSSFLYAYSPTSCKGAHLDSFKMSFQDLPKDNFCWLKLSFQWTLSLKDWNYRSNNLFYNWYWGPRMVWMYILMNVLLVAGTRWWHVGQCAISFHDVLCLYFSELLPVSFNQEEQKLACTWTEVFI